MSTRGIAGHRTRAIHAAYLCNVPLPDLHANRRLSRPQESDRQKLRPEPLLIFVSNSLAEVERQGDAVMNVVPVAYREVCGGRTLNDIAQRTQEHSRVEEKSVEQAPQSRGISSVVCADLITATLPICLAFPTAT